MEFNLSSLEEFEQFTYEMKELFKKLQILFKDFGNKLLDVCKDKQSQHIMNIFKENVKSSVVQFSDIAMNLSSSFQNQYTKMKEKEVYLYKQRKEFIKVYKNKQNLVKIANDQYKVSLKEIKKTNKNPKSSQKSGGSESYLSEAIFYDKQRKILEKNLKQIQNAQDELDDHAAEQAKVIFEEFTESIQFMESNQKELFKGMNKQFSELHSYVKNEILSNLNQQNKQAVQSYQNTLVFRFNFNKKQKQQDHEQRRRNSANSFIQMTHNERNEDQSPFLTRSRSFINLSNFSQKPKLNSQKKQISSFQSFQDVNSNNVIKRSKNIQQDIMIADTYQPESQLNSKKQQIASYSPQLSKKQLQETRYFKQQKQQQQEEDHEYEDNQDEEEEEQDTNSFDENNQINQNFQLTENNEISNNSKYSENSKQMRMFNSNYSLLTASKMRQGQSQMMNQQRQITRQNSQYYAQGKENNQELQSFQQFKKQGQQVEQIQIMPNSQLKNRFSSIQDKNQYEYQGQNIQRMTRSSKSYKNTPVKYNQNPDQVNSLMRYSQKRVKQFNQTPNQYVSKNYN